MKTTVEIPEPTVELVEMEYLGVNDLKIGQEVRAIINFKVVERTKNFAILRVNFVHMLNTARSF